MPAPPTTPPPALRPYLGDTDEAIARHEQLWHEADAFTAEYVAPRIERMEAAPHRIERKVAELMARRGWFAVTVPSAFGGLGLGHVAKTILIHRIARTSAAAAAILQATLIPVGAVSFPRCASGADQLVRAGWRGFRFTGSAVAWLA